MGYILNKYTPAKQHFENRDKCHANRDVCHCIKHH
jgi:hypothetical protein